MTLSHLLTWQNAAWREAARLRHPEIDVDHLYVALISQGGSAARVLGRHGITLSSARTSARSAASDALRTLNVDLAAIPQPPVRDVRGLHHGSVGSIPLSSAARALVDNRGADFGRSADTLRALLTEPSGRVRRLVRSQGVDLDEVLTELADAPEDALTPERVPPDPALAPGMDSALRRTFFIPAEPTTVADVIADPDVLSWWAVEPERLRRDGVDLYASLGRRRETVLRLLVDHLEAAASTVRWTQRLVGGRHDGEINQVDVFECAAADGGTEVRHTRSGRTYGLLGRALRPAVLRIAAMGMLHQSQALTFAVADADHD